MSSVQLFCGDCLDVMATLAPNSIDSIVTDPPYMLNFMGKAFDRAKNNPAANVEVWEAALRVAKPGAMLLAFGGDRTHHRLMAAIEDAGWELRTCLYWITGSGFPKSLDISKAIDKHLGAEREVIGLDLHSANRNGTTFHGAEYKGGWTTMPEGERTITAPATDAARQWDGWGTALKPAAEIIVMARKPLSEPTVAANVLKWGVAGLNVDACRIAHNEECKPMAAQSGGNKVYGQAGRYEPTTELKANGRWPSNLLLDEAAAALLDQMSGERKGDSPGRKPRIDYGKDSRNTFNKGWNGSVYDAVHADIGGASRYFKVIKVARSDFSMYNTPVERGAICGQENMKGVDTSVGKRTESNADSLRVDGYGNNITGLFQPDTIFITKTATNSIMTFPILSALTSTSIGTCTIESESDISWLKELSIESVSDADNGNLLITTSDDQQVLIKATVRIANGTHLQNGESETESITTPICASTASGINEILSSGQFPIITNGRGSISRNGDALPRFFYVAKSSRRDRDEGLEGMPERKAGALNMRTDSHSERNGMSTAPRKNGHPTVKPTKLMQWLVRLVTPPNGTVLDPFLGSGSTLKAAKLEGFNGIGIEIDAEYMEIARRRIEAVQPEQRLQLPLLEAAG